MTKFWIAVLKWFGLGWVVLGFIAIALGIVGTWMKGGFSAVQELMSPYNFWNMAAVFITLAPGLGALYWADKLAAKHRQPGSSSSGSSKKTSSSK
jgi:hypothetical protein